VIKNDYKKYIAINILFCTLKKNFHTKNIFEYSKIFKLVIV